MLKQELSSTLPPGLGEREVRGSIVNTCSLAGFAILPELAAYTSTKHAVLVMTRVDAREYAPHRIRVNSIAPGFVPTALAKGAGLQDNFYNSFVEQSPMQRLTYPDEIADSAVFLASSKAFAITGVNLSVDAGASLFHVSTLR